MKSLKSYLFENLWFIIISLVLGYVFNHIGHCYQTSSPDQCFTGQLDYYTFDFIGFILDAVGFYALLLVGSFIGKQKLKNKIIKEINNDNPLGNNAKYIGERYNLKLPFEHYEAVRRFIVSIIDG